MSLWLLLLVMSLATYRLTRLAVADTFPPVLWLRDRIAGGWREVTEPELDALLRGVDTLDEALAVNPYYREFDGAVNRCVIRKRWSPYWLAELVSCPWCASGWVASAVTAGTWAVVGLPVPLLVWPAVWAVGALIAAQDWA